ncbi:hypothetical protein HD593_002111 [Nonomuraea rubra]|uniref:Uncharacterized protein n=1 Tax=Nonomuraea rubra TaxID=46180 RepID=A0A7X0NPQ1_9ACTN|nr:hypothetical protein [Nonomuraea rubra]
MTHLPGEPAIVRKDRYVFARDGGGRLDFGPGR